ncbi:hybrid sensor histidine kinase/response regulator [Rhodoferax sp. AJA081-3]|uniref:hybrid sensor histidine kinase/response regulator n=1 Tax=Rhodoferax sp. AJA081-3 TaxID=2752316 RepID=UPI001ADFC1D0|nr:hybrid sensor histidine kinase/response regulator [Rhodoferax sp. AJA081-3]QTN27493.1 hybrid sensor histidine kinase/response regulator [Rhodoferax sp. AJA081-3]
MSAPDTPALKTVLAVDDTPENLAVVNALLRGLYKVKVASNGEHALAIAAAAVPDLILLDIMMPGLDGYEVCRRLKDDPATRDIPVIFLTAKSDEAGEQQGFDLGAVDYITKPISPPLLLARVKAQLSLKEARDALERRNAEDKRRFELAMAQQVELNALKSSFVSMTTHEFRTPLTTILSSQELLVHYGDRLSAAERGDTLRSIEGAARRMVVMLDQVLTIGKADANLLEFRPKPLDLATLCRQLRDEAQAGQVAPDGSQADLLTLELNLGEGPVMADEKLLRHILGNLLSNAIKYSPNGQLACFSAHHSAPGELVFEVRDQGIGIPAGEIPKLFGNFHRATNVGDIPGTGLGLTIVKRAVESHGGSIAVQSELGRGTCFTVRIPV